MHHIIPRNRFYVNRSPPDIDLSTPPMISHSIISTIRWSCVKGISSNDIRWSLSEGHRFDHNVTLRASPQRLLGHQNLSTGINGLRN